MGTGGAIPLLSWRRVTSSYRDRIQHSHHTLAIIGDMQRTMGYQRLLGRERDNDAQRRALLRDIEQRDVGCIVLAGDLVTFGDSARDWAYFDDVMAGVRGRDVPTLPVLGNHDYFVFRRCALPHLHKRFPRLASATWYVERLGPLALVIIDSNRGPLGRALWESQRAWLAEQVATLDAAPDVRGVLFFGHHPPFTNSWEVGPHAPTRRDLLPIFHDTHKSLAYVSGHCHAYERFQDRGKTFLVTGGGGGPRQPLRRGMFARSVDAYPGGVIRPFHYLSLEVTDRGIDVEVRGLDKGECGLRTIERFGLPWTV